MAIDTDKLLAAIDQCRANSYGGDTSSELGIARAKAIEYYLGLNTNPAPEGRSQVVDRSVYETISTLMPSLVRIFASSSEDVCKFLPVGPEDEAAAEQTTAAINHVVTQINPWEQVFTDWAHDAMLLGNGYCLAYWDQTDRNIRETYEGQSDDQLAALVQDKGVKVIQHSEYVDQQATSDAQQGYQQAMLQWQQAMPQWQMAAQQAQAQGQPPPPPPQQPQKPQPVLLHDVVIERRENEGKVCLTVLPPEHCRVAIDTPDYSLRDCSFFEYAQEKTISDLRAMGLEVSDDISDDEDDEDTLEDSARDRFAEDTDGDEEGPARKVWARMGWVKCDAEDDEVRMYMYIRVGRTVLHSEPAARIPVASMTPHPLPHRHIGMSEAEVVADIQDVKTAVKRGGLDNLYLANNGRHVISSRVNLSDFLDARPGGVIRMIDDSLPGDGHVMPLVHPVAFDQIIGSLEYLDQERQNRTGASRYFSGTDAGAINKTASGTIALQNMASMRVEHIARTMAPAVEYLFECVHEIVSKHQNKALAVKLKGNWVNIDPQAWRTKRDVRISVGVGAGNKESMIAQLGQIYGAQMQLLPLGLCGPEQIHATVTEMAKLAGFSNPAKFWIDPSRMPPQQPQPSPEQIKMQGQMQIEQFKAQQEQQRLQMQAELDRNREEMQARQKMLEAEQSAQLEAQKAQIAQQAEIARLEFEKWKAELDAAIKLQIAKMGNDAAMSAAPKEDPRMAEVVRMMQELEQERSSPAELIRDQSGRAIAVKRGKRQLLVRRDPVTGKAIGLQ